MAEAQPTPAIDVGAVWSGALAEPLARHPGLVDVVSVIPETLWHEASRAPRYRWIPTAVAVFDAATTPGDVVFHGIGLSLGSGLPLDGEHLQQVAAAAERYRARWYSEHLAAFRVGHESLGQVHAGVGLPVPFDAATLRTLVPKVAATIARVGRPVLLENSAAYVELPEQELTEAGFLNRIGDETGAGVLLDLHNLVVSERNCGWDAEAYLAELDLTRVVEVHVAGGEQLGRWYTDAHSGAAPERVWDLLHALVPHAPALRLVTFELHESRYDELGGAGLVEQLDRIRHATRAVAHVA